MSDMAPMPVSVTANDVVRELIEQFARELEGKLSGDVLSYKGPIVQPIDVMIRDALEARRGKSGKLVVVLETEGGHLDSELPWATH